MIGSHLVASREATLNGTLGNGSMPVQMIQSIMNQSFIHETDHKEAYKGLTSMLTVVEQAKRSRFMLPMTDKPQALIIKKWALSSSEAGDVARKILPYIVERHAQQADQIVALSYTEISATEAKQATQQMRTLTHYLDTTNSAGIGIDPRMALFNPNLSNVQKWAEQSEDIQAQATARGLLQSFEETKRIFVESGTEED
jgi:hypothetical protein